ncbi:Protein FAM214A [Triplophysa tibetana]|uniref:Atos homolog protein A n=1 Tax=Triplophysa tibetana TaxID=1572043 RepID=A0A5A9P0S3_9TELE|nr:Protein FAM214A [Triplophysa tibetana]
MSILTVCVDAAEEFFEYDAEDLLVFLTFLITEGRTPECSVKGRTEGLHCPPAQSAMPVLTKHECSDKIPQLSAWLSASHGLVPRNILYRISAADEELILNFSQTPSEHAFPVPNVSHSVALKVRVQSLPRQPKYPILRCSIHSGLALLGKKGQERGEGGTHACEKRNSLRLPGSPLLSRPLRSSPSPLSPLNSRKCIPRPVSPLSPGKGIKWLYSRLNGGVDVPPTEVYSSCSNGAESPKTSRVESPVRSFKSLSLTDPLLNPSPSPNSISGETNPLIGSLLQERQEVIARIAQRLNFCDPTAPHLPDALFAPHEPPGPKTPWSSPQNKERLKKPKESLFPVPQPASYNGTSPEKPERSRSSLFDTPLSPRSRTQLGRVDGKSKTSPKLSTCRRLVLSDQSAEGSLIADAVQDISRLIQERLQHSYSLLNATYKCKASQTEQVGTSHSAQTNGCASPTSSKKPSNVTNGAASTDHPISQATKCCTPPDSTQSQQDCFTRPRNMASQKLEDHSSKKSRLLTTSNYRENAKRESCSSLKNNFSHERSLQENGLTLTGHLEPTTTKDAIREKRTEKHVKDGSNRPEKDENQEPWTSYSSTPANLTHNSPSHALSYTQSSHTVPQRKNQTGYFDLDTSLIQCKGVPWAANKRVLKRSQDCDESQQQILSASASPASLSLLGNFEECVLNYRLEPLGTVEGFTAEVGASGTFCPSHTTLPVDVSFYSVSDDNAPSPYMTLFNPNQTVVKMFVVMYDLREMPAAHQTFLRQRTFSVPVKRECNGQNNKKPPTQGQGRTLRYLIHLRFQSSKSGKIYLHRDIRFLFSRKSMEVDSGAAYELKSFTESPADPPFSPRC